MTAEAQNSMLKVLEEPSDNSVIILVTAKPQVLFKTIISRCQRVKFSLSDRLKLQGILHREYSFDTSLAHYLAYSCEGRLGLALTLKDHDPIVYKNRIIDGFLNPKADITDSLSSSDRSKLKDALNILAQWFRDIYLLKTGVAHNELINLDRKNDLLKLMQRYSFSDIEEILGCISDSIQYLGQNINTKLMLANLKSYMEAG
jgi:DNA polymerase-3 subunit delta'